MGKMEETSKEEREREKMVQVLEALKEASEEIQRQHSPESPAAKALLELDSLVSSSDPNLWALSEQLRRLKSVLHSLQQSTGLRSFLTRPLSSHSLSRVAGSIQSELQAWIDRETLHGLSACLRKANPGQSELVSLLSQFQERLSRGFNRGLQELVLKHRLFSSLDSLLLDAKLPNRLREEAALAVYALIRFNKDVFVGQVLMGPTVGALLSMGSVKSISLLSSLIRSIRSPLVDEIQSNGGIPKVMGVLDSDDDALRVAALECVMEIGYFGRKEAVEAMVKEGVVEKLMELQRSEGKLFAGSVARFAVQLEVGEGLRQREKRGFKGEILGRVREASVSDAEAATVAAEVLWGSSP